MESARGGKAASASSPLPTGTGEKPTPCRASANAWRLAGSGSASRTSGGWLAGMSMVVSPERSARDVSGPPLLWPARRVVHDEVLVGITAGGAGRGKGSVQLDFQFRGARGDGV